MKFYFININYEEILILFINYDEIININNYLYYYQYFYYIYSPLNLAVSQNNVEIVKLLLTNDKIDVNKLCFSTDI